MDTVLVPIVPGIGCRPGPATAVSVRRPDRPRTTLDTQHPEVPSKFSKTLEIAVRPPSWSRRPGATFNLSNTLYRMGLLHALDNSGSLVTGGLGDTSMVAPYSNLVPGVSFLDPVPENWNYRTGTTGSLASCHS